MSEHSEQPSDPKRPGEFLDHLDPGTLGGPFPSTRWTLIRDCRDPDTPDYRSGLEVLCRKYWPPIYWFIRRNWKKSREEAKDLCQAFFVQLFEKEFVGSFDVDRGRFRSFICGALQRFLGREHRDSQRLKRQPAEGLLLSMDDLGEEEDQAIELADESAGIEDLEEGLRTAWKRAIVRNALASMRETARGTEREVSVEVFARFRIEHDQGAKPTRMELGKAFGLTLHQIRYALRWGEKNFFDALRKELLDQVSSPEDFETEARELFEF